MGDWIRQLGVLFLVAATSTAAAENITALVKGTQSFHLTPEEKALFVEASDRFKKYEIPKSILTNDVFWLDNDHLAMSSRQYPGWEAKPEEMSRIISYNVTNSQITDSGYRGIIRCINHLGDVLITQEEKESLISKSFESYTWLSGKWGSDLAPTHPPKNSFVPSYLCRFASYGTLNKRIGPNGNEFLRESITPLLESHGGVEEVSETKNDKTKTVAHLIKESGEKILLSHRHLNYLSFIYMPWQTSYFEATSAPPEPIAFSPGGKTEFHRLPMLLSIWHQFIHTSVAADPSKRGILWTVQQRKGFWRKQGIFLQLDSELLRVEEGQALSNLKSSPNGCRIHARVFRGDPFKRIDSKDIRLIIEFC
jgi:hypothetical protein